MGHNVAWVVVGGDHLGNPIKMGIIATVDKCVRGTYGRVRNTHSVRAQLRIELGLEYGTIFLIVAVFDQNPSRSYESLDYERLKNTQRQVDPDGLICIKNGRIRVK